MRKITSAFFLALVLAAPAWSQIPLRVEGETEIVVKKLPFLVHAPKGSDLYFWSYPLTVEATENGEKLTVTKAPKGRHTFRLKTISVNWDSKKLEQSYGETVVVVGEVPPEPNPNPDPEPEPKPLTEFEKKIASAFKADGSPKEKAEILATLYREVNVNESSLKTVGDLFRVLKVASGKLLSPTDMPSVRRTIADLLNATLPTSPTAALDTATRQKASDAFKQIANALGKVK